VSADQAQIYNQLTPKKAFMMDGSDENTTWETSKKPAMIQWWNGISALLDFTNPVAINWFNEQLDFLVETYGVDGFKLDAGDMNFYPDNALSKQTISPNEHCRLYAEIGLRFPLNEYRACWKMAGQPIAQRLHDKNHNWQDAQKLIPHMITEGLVGYTFSCPDMIGGGEYKSFLKLDSYDEDLVVRSAQCHALMPMMQFSVAPWRILSPERLEAVKAAVATRMKFTPKIMELARGSAQTGEPIITNLEYYFPNQGYETVLDQFMLGEDILVAPLVDEGTSREVALPKGKWISDTGEKYKGGKSYMLEVPIDRLPYFEKIK
jgi:alpha-glucosidase